MIPDECVERIEHSQIKVSGPGSTSAVFANPNRQPFRRIRFDGCVVKGRTACDWVLEREQVGRIAIELKGSKVGHAARQVASALKFLAAHDEVRVKVAGLIVCSRVPKTAADVQQVKDRFRVEFRAKLHVMQERNCRKLSFEELLGVG